MSGWLPADSPVVSIICTTYNQEAYIGQALDGFLLQETDFPYDIVIHDDASTDDTRNIILAYKGEYPKLIRPILQESNQFSRGGFRPAPYAASKSTGEFLAFCEGDDFWIDPCKLQLQVDALRRHPETDMVVHSAYFQRGDKVGTVPSKRYDSSRLYGPGDILSVPYCFSPTASLMLRREVVEKLPPWFYTQAPFGDFFLEMYGAQKGGAVYIDRPMSIYREYATGSHTSRQVDDADAINRISRSLLLCLDLMEADFPGLEEFFDRKRSAALMELSKSYLLKGEDKQFQEAICESVQAWCFFDNKQKLYYYLRVFPTILRFLHKVRARQRARTG